MKKIVVRRERALDLPLFLSSDTDDPSYTITLAEDGASVHVQAVLLAPPGTELAATITVIHAAPYTKSTMDIRGLVLKEATVNAQGMVRIEEGAKGSDAKLKAKYLTLSDDARCGFTPSLEIFEQDVAASHSLTIGKIDEQALFYLLSRGIPIKSARKLIAHGFVREILPKLPPSSQKSIDTLVRDNT